VHRNVARSRKIILNASEITTLKHTNETDKVTELLKRKYTHLTRKRTANAEVESKIKAVQVLRERYKHKSYIPKKKKGR
jgi:hypothetical protein